MSLFLKIFLWFWLSIALVVAAITFVNWSTQGEPLVRQWQTFIGEAVNINAQTAVQIYENEGQPGLDEYLNRVASAERVIALGIFDQNRRQIAGTQLSAEGAEMFNRTYTGDEIEFNRMPEQTIAGKKILTQKRTDLLLHYRIPPTSANAFFDRSEKPHFANFSRHLYCRTRLLLAGALSFVADQQTPHGDAETFRRRSANARCRAGRQSSRRTRRARQRF